MDQKIRRQKILGYVNATFFIVWILRHSCGVCRPLPHHFSMSTLPSLMCILICDPSLGLKNFLCTCTWFALIGHVWLIIRRSVFPICQQCLLPISSVCNNPSFLREYCVCSKCLSAILLYIHTCIQVRMHTRKRCQMRFLDIGAHDIGRLDRHGVRGLASWKAFLIKRNHPWIDKISRHAQRIRLMRCYNRVSLV